MIQDNKEYLQRLIKEAFNEAAKKPFEGDELEDLEDEYTVPITGGTKEKTSGTKEQGWHFKQNKNNDGVPKKISDHAAERKRKGLPYSPISLGAEWDKKEGSVQKDILNPDKYGRIKVMVSSPFKSDAYDFPIIVITLLNIDAEDCGEIKGTFQKVGNTERVNTAKTRVGMKSAGVSFIIAERYIKNWIDNDLEKVINFLGVIKDTDGNSKYFKSQEEEQNLRDYIVNRTVTSNDLGDMITSANRNNIELFNAFIEAENDEDVQNFIKLYQRFGLINQLCNDLGLSVSFGKILSIQNAALVLGSGRLSGAGVKPTFILTEKMWFEFFNRRVNPNGRPFYIFVPDKRRKINKKYSPQFTSKPYQLTDKNGKTVEINSTPDVLNTLYFGKKWEELSSQQKIAASQMCNYINPSECYPMAEFDVSDTYPLDPNNDIFEKEMGMVNIFTGELNQAAMDFVKQQGLMDDENKNETQGDEGFEDAFQLMAKKINDLALRNIDEYCQYEKIHYTKVSDDVSKSIINALHNIAVKHISLRKPENIEILAGDAVYASCILYRIALDLASSIRRGKPTDSTEATLYIDAFHVLAKAIEGSWKQNNKDVEQGKNSYAMVTEDEEINNSNNNLIKKYSDEQLTKFALSLFDLNENTYNAYNNFNTLLERMDNSKYNRKL